MQKSHTSPNDCIYTDLKKFLINSKYLDEDAPEFRCECSRRRPVYTSEWDSEFREYFYKHSGGVNGALQMIETILLSEDLSELSEDLKEKVEVIPAIHRERLVDFTQMLRSKEYPPFVERIALTINDDYKGYVDLAPTGGISEVILKPPLWMKPPKYYLTCEQKFNPTTPLFRYDKCDEIKCVPFSKVQSGVGVCAQYAVRMALMNVASTAPTVPELTFRASRKILSGGIERSHDDGWNAREITHIIENEGYGTFRLSREFCEVCKEPLQRVKCTECGVELLAKTTALPNIENIYAYVESGIPVLIAVKDVSCLPWWKGDCGTDAHALVAIGHTLSENGAVDGLIVHDESMYPYQVLPIHSEGNYPYDSAIMEAIVPLHREITTDYPKAKELALEIASFAEGLDEGVEYRPMLVEADYINRLGEGLKREHFQNYSINNNVKKGLSHALLDRYIWLFEMKRELGNNKRKYEGDVLISATRPVVLGFNFPSDGVFGFNDESGEVKFGVY